MKNALTDAAKKDGIEETAQSMFAYLIDRVRANLHVVLGMSPVGEAFRSVFNDCLSANIVSNFGFHIVVVSMYIF